jgi:hypothetical protein
MQARASARVSAPLRPAPHESNHRRVGKNAPLPRMGAATGPATLGKTAAKVATELKSCGSGSRAASLYAHTSRSHSSSTRIAPMMKRSRATAADREAFNCGNWRAPASQRRLRQAPPTNPSIGEARDRNIRAGGRAHRVSMMVFHVEHAAALPGGHPVFHVKRRPRFGHWTYFPQARLGVSFRGRFAALRKAHPKTNT